MKKSSNKSFQKTLAFAATVAALGASVGVPSEALSAPLGAAPATDKAAQSPGANAGGAAASTIKLTQDKAAATQGKLNQDKSPGASQLKLHKGAAANQLKLKK